MRGVGVCFIFLRRSYLDQVPPLPIASGNNAGAAPDLKGGGVGDGKCRSKKGTSEKKNRKREKGREKGKSKSEKGNPAGDQAGFCRWDG